EEELRQRAGACERRSRLAYDRRQLERSLGEWVTPGELPVLQQAFPGMDPEQLEQLDGALAERMAQTERQLNEWREQRGRLSAELEQLSGAGEQPGELLQRREEQAAAAGQAAAEWAQLALCAGLIRSARQ